MVVDAAVSRKEVLAFLIRASQLAEKALANLNKGNPFDAVRLIKVIAKLDASALHVLANVPNYETHVKPYHAELVNECRAILALSQQALQEVSPELRTWSAEKLAKYAALFSGCLDELDKELKAENKIKHWISEAEKAFGSQKAWTYSRIGLENALRVLNSLVQDQNAMKQTVERYSNIFRGAKHADPKRLVEDLIKKRLMVKKVAEFIVENAFRSLFSFGDGHDWHSELARVSNLPEENIKELEALRQQLLGSVVFVKRNIHYARLSQLLERLAALSQHARKVERAIEIAELAAKEQGKTEEELLREYWESHVRNGFVYHGTSSIFFPNIEHFGLSSEQIFSEGTPFRPEDYTFFLEISRKAYGADAQHLKYFTQDVTRGFFLDTNYAHAVGYARQGPERIRFVLEHIRSMEEEFRRGIFAGKVLQQEIHRLLQILGQYEQTMSHHRPVVLHIPLSSPALLTVLRRNGPEGALVASMVADYNAFRQYVMQEFGLLKQTMQQQFGSAVHVTDYLRSQSPFDRFFHNRPLKGAIPWASIAKAEYV